jgi:hypothetical protein
MGRIRGKSNAGDAIEAWALSIFPGAVSELIASPKALGFIDSDLNLAIMFGAIVSPGVLGGIAGTLVWHLHRRLVLLAAGRGGSGNGLPHRARLCCSGGCRATGWKEAVFMPRSPETP